MSQLTTKFRGIRQIRRDRPLTEEEIRTVAPSIYSEQKHDSRSNSYSVIPTCEILSGLQKEGFEPFMVCQSGSRIEGKEAYTKHMMRLRHASQITASEANEIILINSHDGTSKYQMLAGVFRFACANGLVCGSAVSDVRIAHKGDVMDNVIEGAHTVLEQFEIVTEQMAAMKATRLSHGAQDAFARAALELRYGDEHKPISIEGLLRPHRREDLDDTVWTTLNRVQENMLRGGVPGRTANGKNSTTRAVNNIDDNVKLNRALWVLADEMRKLSE